MSKKNRATAKNINNEIEVVDQSPVETIDTVENHFEPEQASEVVQVEEKVEAPAAELEQSSDVQVLETTEKEEEVKEPEMVLEDLLKSHKSKSGVMRYLDSLGWKRSKIATFMGVRYQFVRNVLIQTKSA